MRKLSGKAGGAGAWHWRIGVGGLGGNVLAVCGCGWRINIVRVAWAGGVALG